MFSKSEPISAWLLLHHGSLIEDWLVIAVIIYLAIMFFLAQLKSRQLKREKLRRKAERLAARAQATAQPLANSIPDEPTSAEKAQS